MALVESWKFQADEVTGYIAGGGEHGIQIVATADGKPGTRGMGMNLEHYYSRSCEQGRFVPRYQAKVHSEQTGEQVVRVRIEPHKDWQIEATVDFAVLPGALIEVRYGFHFLAAYRGFEAFVSNYFHDPTEPHLHLNGQWVRPTVADNEHRFWLRSPADAENTLAVRHAELTPSAEIIQPIDPVCFDHPVMVTPIAGSTQSIVNIVEAEHCPSLSVNRRWNAHDFSLLGRDVAAGERVTCRAWFACTTLASLDDALRLQPR
ncbi:MAG: hypothetical protein PCFJNLEI_01581 [Verrucomicrobiae bacterium]|nr:hypothetical protein [Verrucomicrobiae bacterium]